MELQELVVGLDLMTDDTPLLYYAGVLARAFGAHVVLCHVNQGAPSLEAHARGQTYLELLDEALRRRLDAFAGGLRENGLEVSVRLLRGKPSHELGEHGTGDLLVIGRSTHDAGDSRLTGSTARYLVRHPQRPLLVVPLPGARARARGERPFDRVLAPTDFGPACRIGLGVAQRLAKRLEASVEVLHVLELPLPLPTLPGEPPLLLPMEVESSVRQSLEASLAEEAARVTGAPVSTRLTVAHRAARGIADAAAENPHTLIVLPTHSRSAVARWWLGSTAERVIQTAAVPTLVLPPGGAA